MIAGDLESDGVNLTCTSTDAFELPHANFPFLGYIYNA